MPRANGTNYYKPDGIRCETPYRKYQQWQDRQAAAVGADFDNDRPRGIVRLPETGKFVCDRCPMRKNKNRLPTTNQLKRKVYG